MPRVAVRLWTGVLVATAALAGTARGQAQPPVELRVSAGFEQQMRAPWSPVTVTVDNRGGEAVRGELIIERALGRGFRARREVYLGPSSTKRFTFYSPPIWGKVRLVVAGKTVREVEVRGQSGFGLGDRLMVVVSRRPGFLKLLERRPDRAFWRGPGASTTRTVAQVSDPTTLPDRWAGYSGVWAVVLSGFQFDGLSALQQRALLGWVQTGGLLIMAPGAEARWLVQPPWQELLQLESAGTRRMTGAPVLERLFGRFEGRGEFLLHRFRYRRALFSGPKVGGWPSYLGVPVGTGLVVVTAFDVGAFPFRGWSGAPAFWQAMLEAAEAAPKPSWRRFEEGTYWNTSSGQVGSALRILSALTARATPVLLITVLVVLYVLAVGPLNYLVLRDYRKRVWLVVTTPVVAAVFVMVVGTVGVAGRGLNALLQHITLLVVGDQADSAYQRTYLGLWSPGSRSFDLETSADGFLQPLSSGPRAMAWERVEAAGFAQRNRLLGAQFRVNELRGFQLDAVRPLGGRLRLEREGEDLVLTNETDLDLRGAHIDTAAARLEFGDVPAGDSSRARRQYLGMGRGGRSAWLRSVAPELPLRRSGPGPEGRDLGRSLWGLADEVTGMMVRPPRGRLYRLEAAVSNLEPPVEVRGGRVRLDRQLVLLVAYLVVE